MARLRVLVIGAGAVGQVFGHHLQRGGAEVAFFVREHHRAEAARGFDLYPLNGRLGAPVHFEGFEVLTRTDEVAARRFDQVYLTVPSTALAGDWLPALIAACGDAILVGLQPGLDDRARLLAAGAAESRLVSGMISLLSYAAPLPGETRFALPGTAYWFPPLAPSPFSGPPEPATAVVRALRVGRLPATRRHDVPRAAAYPTAIMMPYLVALESADWSLRTLARGDGMRVAARGARAALAVVARGRGIPLYARLVSRPWVVAAGLWVARRVVPLPLEPYIERHFTKVREQTIALMITYIQTGKRAGLDVAPIEALLASLPTSISKR